MTAAALVFFASVALLAYTFAGYLLLLAAWARLRPRPVAKAPATPRVAIVMAVHDGEAFLERKIASCLAQDYPAGLLRLVIASDGSADRTEEIARAAGDARVTVLAFAGRRGKAACINDAVLACHEEVLVMTDVRQPLEPGAVRRLVENLADPNVGAVSGRLVHERAGMSDLGEGLDAYHRYEQVLRRAESRVHSMVGVMGALYAVRRECYRPIPADTVLDDVLVPMEVVRQGRRVVYEYDAVIRDDALSDARRERKRKVRTLAGNFQLLARHPWLLSPRANPLWLQFMSHKVCRLAGPVALFAALVSNAVLAAGDGAFFKATLALQLAGYAAAALGALSPAAARLRLVRLAMAYLSLNGFVVLGFIEFASRRGIHLWDTVGTRPANRHE